MDAARLVARISVAGAQAGAAALKGFGGQVDKTGGSLSRVTGGTGQMARGIARIGVIAGGVVAAGMFAGAKAAITYEDAFAGVKKTVSETDLTKAGLSFEKLHDSFLTMSTKMPIAAADLARIGEAAGALGVQAGDIATFTETVAKLGVTTNLTTEAAAESLGKVGTILHLTGKDYVAFSDILVNLGNNGASTESEILEITKRFAAAGKQAGLTTPQILAMSSAVASMGIEPEAAGGALSRIFNNMGTEIALATDKGKAFADITGRSIKGLQRDVNAGNGFKIFNEFLAGLQGLSKVDFNKALKSAGFTNTRDRNAIMLMAQNMGFFASQVKTAENSVGSLDKEAQKRFDTIASKFQVLKNIGIKAGIGFGEGMLPALGRVTEKLGAFVTSHEDDLKRLGADVGGYIDRIDFDRLAAAADRFGDIMGTVLGVVKQIPVEIDLAIAAFLGMDKLSGGLLSKGAGNILGGLGGMALGGLGAIGGKRGALGGAISRIGAQRVWIAGSDIPLGMGGAGGVGAAGKGMGLVSKMFLVGEAIGLGLMVNEIREGIADGNTKLSSDIRDTNAALIASKPTPEALKQAMAGVDQGIRDLTSNPLFVLVQGEALTNLQQMKASLVAANQRAGVGTGSPDRQDRREGRIDERGTTAPEREGIKVEIKRLAAIAERGGERGAKALIKLDRIRNGQDVVANKADQTNERLERNRAASIHAGRVAAAAANGTTSAIRRKRFTLPTIRPAGAVINLDGRRVGQGLVKYGFGTAFSPRVT